MDFDIVFNHGKTKATCEEYHVRDMFFIEQDVRVLFEKLAQKTYELHKNNAKKYVRGFKKTPIQCFTIRQLG
jgi:hypothetical protein